MIIDASDLILGRMATVAAKKALAGEEVVIVNCEKAVITGKRNDIAAKYMKRIEIGQPTKGPFVLRRPDMLVRRTIRGMVPRKKTRGREAFKKVKCFISMPENIKAEQIETIKDATRSSSRNFITVKELCRLIGNKNPRDF